MKHTRPLVVSVAAVITRGKKVLVARRSQQNRHYRDFWEFPGGKVRPGENPEKAVKREVKEELGIGIALSKKRYFDFILLRNKAMLVLAFRCQGTGTKLKPGPMFSQTAWYLPSRLKNLKMIPSDKGIRAWVARK